MQIYLRGYCLYGFNRQKAIGAKYMDKNLWASQKRRKDDEKNIEHKGNMTTKS